MRKGVAAAIQASLQQAGALGLSDALLPIYVGDLAGIPLMHSGDILLPLLPVRRDLLHIDLQHPKVAPATSPP